MVVLCESFSIKIIFPSTSPSSFFVLQHSFFVSQREAFIMKLSHGFMLSQKHSRIPLAPPPRLSMRGELMQHRVLSVQRVFLIKTTYELGDGKNFILIHVADIVLNVVWG
jgi:hypothetical protein